MGRLRRWLVVIIALIHPTYVVAEAECNRSNDFHSN